MTNSCVGLRSLEKLGQDPEFYRGGQQPVLNKQMVVVSPPRPVKPVVAPMPVVPNNAWRAKAQAVAQPQARMAATETPIDVVESPSAEAAPIHTASAVWEIKRELTRQLDRLGVTGVVIGHSHAAMARLSDQLPLQSLVRTARAFIDTYDTNLDVLPTSVQTLKDTLVQLDAIGAK